MILWSGQPQLETVSNLEQVDRLRFYQWLIRGCHIVVKTNWLAPWPIGNQLTIGLSPKSWNLSPLFCQIVLEPIKYETIPILDHPPPHTFGHWLGSESLCVWKSEKVTHSACRFFQGFSIEIILEQNQNFPPNFSISPRPPSDHKHIMNSYKMHLDLEFPDNALTCNISICSSNLLVSCKHGITTLCVCISFLSSD